MGRPMSVPVTCLHRGGRDKVGIRAWFLISLVGYGIIGRMSLNKVFFCHHFALAVVGFKHGLIQGRLLVWYKDCVTLLVVGIALIKYYANENDHLLSILFNMSDCATGRENTATRVL